VEQALQSLINQLKARSLTTMGEEATKQGVILPILTRLGWDSQNTDEVYPEYGVGGGNVDYCLRLGDQDRVFIECKKPMEDLDDQEHQEQFLRYAFESGVDLAVLTNGISWWFYLPREKSHWQQRKFFAVDLVQMKVGDVSSNLIAFLSKDNVSSGNAEKTAQSLYKKGREENAIKSFLPRAWNKTIADADESLIDLIASATERLSGTRPSNDSVGRFIAENQNGLSLAEQVEAQRPLRSTKGPSAESKYQPTGYTGKQIASFSLDGKSYQPSSWRDMLVKICELTFQSNPQGFEKVSSLRGKKRFYFSANANALTSAAKVKGSKFFVETNLSANSIVKLSTEILSLAGKKGDLRISTS
jgi:predicted type IV restriction endonuclease